MKILAISDEKSKSYYDYYMPGKLDEFDLIISCGDLSKEYLEFLVTMAHCPLIYVRGNHDDSFLNNPPEGCDCIEDKIYEYRGVRILGLGGSYRYKDGINMYSEKQMKHRIFKLSLKLFRSKGFDILVSHSPAKGLNDGKDIAHRGFECFLHLMDKYAPKYFIHGHMHRTYGYKIPQTSQYNNTIVVNAYQHYIIDYPNDK